MDRSPSIFSGIGYAVSVLLFAFTLFAAIEYYAKVRPAAMKLQETVMVGKDNKNISRIELYDFTSATVLKTLQKEAQ